MSTTINGTSGVTFPDGTNQTTSPFTGGLGFRNRIINGDFRIDQRNAGASVSAIPSGNFAIDRWAYYSNATAGAFNAGQNLNSVTPPAGFTKYLGFQVASTQTPSGSNAYFFGHKIEGFNVADLGWGAVGAQTITISFWVRSSVTGTHSGNVQNTSNARSYVFSYTINSANTWEQKTVTIAGDTSGTWPTDNTAGLVMFFNLGCGSGIQTTAGAWNAAQYIGVTGGVSVVSNASATFYITGVQLEKGSTATSFDYRPYGTELALCQRYYWKGTINAGGVFGGSGGSIPIIAWGYPVSMRSAPTFAWISGGNTSNGNASYSITGVVLANAYTDSAQILWSQSGSTGTNAQGAMTTAAVSSFAAEL